MTRRLAFALGVTVAALAGVVDDRVLADSGAGSPACRDVAPRWRVVRVHLRCDLVPVRPPQRLDFVIGRLDAPWRIRQAWGGDSSLAWADEELDRHGCAPHVWHDGERVVGIDCDY